MLKYTIFIAVLFYLLLKIFGFQPPSAVCEEYSGEYRILFKGILTLLGLIYRDASLITLFFVARGISIPKIRRIG